MYYLAYQNIYAKEGNMTEGSDSKTIDGMSAKRIERLIASLKDHSYHPNPARRTYIQKNNNPQKKRPLGIPSFDDKLLQEVVRMILDEDVLKLCTDLVAIHNDSELLRFICGVAGKICRYSGKRGDAMIVRVPRTCTECTG